MLAREEYSLLMVTSERMNNKNIYKEQQFLVRADEDKLSVLSLLRLESCLDRAGFRMHNIVFDMYKIVHVWTCTKTPYWYSKSTSGCRNCVLMTWPNLDEPAHNSNKWKQLMNVRNSVLRECNPFPRAIEEDCRCAGLNVHNSRVLQEIRRLIWTLYSSVVVSEEWWMDKAIER